MDDILGFTLEPAAGGEFTGLCKYDARSGRIFRVERVNTGNGFVSEPVDITATFRAVADFDNMQSGWMDFPPGSAPSFALVPLAAITAGTIDRPAQPSIKHKHGVRFRLKLSKACSGESKPIREIAGTAKAFLNGIAEVYREYTVTRQNYPGQLPVLTLVSALPVVSGTGATRSTNYQPKFHIDGWKPRPEDMPAVVTQPAMAIVTPLPPPTAPVTGAQTVPPPNRYQAPVPIVPQANNNLADDFG